MERILAIDLGGTKTAVGIVDSRGAVLDKETEPTPLEDSGRAVELIGLMAQRLQARAGKAEALGLALPGIVDRDRGLLLRSPSSGWRNVPFLELIERRVGLEGRAENDVNACAWAEARFGAGRDLDSFFWMTVSTGVGGAVVTGGRVLRGANAMAGEIGHLVVNPGGRRCGCGNRGCLEAEAAGPAWRELALELLVHRGHRGRGGDYLAGLPSEEIDARAVAEGARAGDAICAEVVDRAALMLARGLASVYCILDPEAVIIGGGVAGALDLLLPRIEAELPSLALSAEPRRTAIVSSALGYDAGLVGAAALALFPY